MPSFKYVQSCLFATQRCRIASTEFREKQTGRGTEKHWSKNACRNGHGVVVGPHILTCSDLNQKISKHPEGSALMKNCAVGCSWKGVPLVLNNIVLTLVVVVQQLEEGAGAGNLLPNCVQGMINKASRRLRLSLPNKSSLVQPIHLAMLAYLMIWCRTAWLII